MAASTDALSQPFVEEYVVLGSSLQSPATARGLYLPVRVAREQSVSSSQSSMTESPP